MKENIKNYGENLKYLCGEFIQLLDNAKSNGVITEEEYKKYSSNKEKFLKSFSDN